MRIFYLANPTDVTNFIDDFVNSKYYRTNKIRIDCLVHFNWDQISPSFSSYLKHCLFSYWIRYKRAVYRLYILCLRTIFFLFRYINLFFLSVCSLYHEKFNISLLQIIEYASRYKYEVKNKFFISINIHRMISSEQSPLYTCKAHIFQVDPDTRKTWIPLSNGAGRK